MAKPKSYTLCSFNCPMKDSCARYCPEMDKSKTDHFAANPFNYDRNRCGFYEHLTDDDIIERINQILKPFNN
jgi:hypothetical protein